MPTRMTWRRVSSNAGLAHGRLDGKGVGTVTVHARPDRLRIFSMVAVAAA
jgi:hypothetical protein